MIKKLIIIVYVFFITTTSCYSQCCSAGNPVGGDGINSGISKNEIRIYTFFRHSLSKDYYHNTNKTIVPIIESSYYDFNNLSVTYGLFEKLLIHSELGYFIDKAQDLNFSGQKDKIKSHGLGDLTINIRYKLHEKAKPETQLIISSGIKFPIGAFNEEQDGIYIPISLQPSSGALKYNASLFYSRKHNESKVGWNSFLMFELSEKIEKDFLVYKYGNYTQFSLGGFYLINKNLTAIANLKYEWRAHDKRENELRIESTGSNVVYFSPIIKYSIKNDFSFILLGEIPFYKDVNGYQLTNFYAWQIGISKDFKPCFQ
ncbi:MAG: hypothetical protein H8E98_06820 [Bacteroidetes bacterium]|nr:hypothetical protein [Bacteroidota bacterium]